MKKILSAVVVSILVITSGFSLAANAATKATDTSGLSVATKAELKKHHETFKALPADVKKELQIANADKRAAYARLSPEAKAALKKQNVDGTAPTGAVAKELAPYNAIDAKLSTAAKEAKKKLEISPAAKAELRKVNMAKHAAAAQATTKQ